MLLYIYIHRFLGYRSSEHPVVCQLGGSDPSKLAESAQIVERYGYDEVNLNVGCPSSRVAMPHPHAKERVGIPPPPALRVARSFVH